MNINKTLTIALTGARPVKIKDDEWPVIGHGWFSDHDGEFDFQANCRWKCDIRVRANADGRAIVYGVYEFRSAWGDERNFETRAGVLTDFDHIPDAITEVALTMCEAAKIAEHGHSCILECATECTTSLPAVEL